MAWTAPLTWVTGLVVTAAHLNTHLRDNLRDRRGLDGTVTFEDGIDLGTNELTINSIEIVGVDGEVNKAAMEQLDHGTDLAGLGDVDHSAYQAITLLTTRGDIIYRNATVWARRAKGTSGQVLTMDANDPVWSGQNTIVFSTASLFNGTAPTSFTDLNISGTVGSNQAVCLIKVKNNSGDATATDFKFRKDDDGDTFGYSGGIASINEGANQVADGSSVYFLIVTDATGVVEWASTAGKGVIITMEAYLI